MPIKRACYSSQNDNYSVQSGQEKTAELGGEVPAYFLAESTYLKILADTKASSGENNNLGSSFSGGLKDGECFFIDGNVTAAYSSSLKGEKMNITLGGVTLPLTVTGTSLHIGLMDLYQVPTVVVNDSVAQSALSQSSSDTFWGFVFDDDMASGATVDALDELIPSRFSGVLPRNLSYIGMYKSSFSLYGSYIFIGLFIGVLFHFATGSVMYYKLIMEAQEEAPRYSIIRKTGFTEKETLCSVAKQLGLVFGLPLLVGLVHTVFALRTYNHMLDLIGQETPTLQNAALVVLVFVAVYGLFYALSVNSYHKILKSYR